MKVAFMASDAIALDCIKMLHAGQCPGFELSCVVSNPDKPKGRGKKMSPNDVSAWAIENGVELMRPEKSPDDSVAGRMRELGVEMIIVMAYGHMLKKNILDYGEYPCINLHASLLPQLRGASPVETAVALGMEKTGVSLMRIEERMDAGAVCAKIEVEISREECAVGLRKKIAAAAARLLKENILSIAEKTAVFAAQDESWATYTRKICKEDFFLDFKLGADEIVNRVRAFSFGIAELDGERLKLAHAVKAERLKGGEKPGEILAASASEGLRVACADCGVVFGEIQKPCAKMLCARDFFAGNDLQVGKIFSAFDSRPLLRRQI